MGHSRYSNDEILRRGQDRYDRELRSRLEPQHRGKFLALDIDTGHYEIDAEDIAAVRRARARNPDAALCILRIGFPTAYKLGGRFRAAQS